MKDAQIAKIDRLALLMVRQEKERSRALPAKAYRDPAETVEFEAELQRKERARRAMALKLNQGNKDGR